MTSYILELKIGDGDDRLVSLYHEAVAETKTIDYKKNPHKDSGFDIYWIKGFEESGLSGKKIKLTRGMRGFSHPWPLPTKNCKHCCMFFLRWPGLIIRWPLRAGG